MAQALMLAIGGILIGLLNLLVGDKFKEYAPWFVRRLLAIATKRLPETQQQRFAEEWASHMNHVSGDIQKVFFAWGCVCAAREMATPLTHNKTKPTLVAWQVVTVVAVILWLYRPTLSGLLVQWSRDENFHHGWVVPLFSAFVIWRERNRLARIPLRASRHGLVVMVGATVLLIMGRVGAELYITRTSLVFMIAGAVILFAGWEFFCALLFPWAFLLLMIPIPALLFNQITFPLQLLASQVSAAILPLLGVPILREGNVINLSSMALEVAEAFSGIRSLMSLATVAIIYGYLMEKRIWLRWLLVFASVPIAIIANSLRVVSTGLLSYYWTLDASEGVFHSAWRVLAFVISLLMLYGLHVLVSRIFPGRIHCP